MRSWNRLIVNMSHKKLITRRKNDEKNGNDL